MTALLRDISDEPIKIKAPNRVLCYFGIIANYRRKPKRAIVSEYFAKSVRFK